jgi:hypothetical protein
MIILKAKTNDGVTTFPFHQVLIPGTTPQQARDAELEAANKAAYYVMKTSAAGFIAEAESVDSASGKILKKWDHRQHLYGDKYSRRLSYHIRGGAYQDTEWAVLGTEEECLRMAEETNAKATCWASVSAHVEHIVGPLWQTVFTDPYKD